MIVLREKWNSFWFTRHPPHLLSVFRIAFALAFLYRTTTYFRFEQLWDWAGGRLYFADFFHVPYWEFHTAPSHEIFSVLIQLRFVFAIAALLGIFGQFSLFVCGSIFLYMFFLDQTFYFHHLYFLGLSAILCSLMPCSETLSVDALVKRWQGIKPPAEVSFVAARCLQVVVALMYFFTALAKSNPAWLSGDIMEFCFNAGLVKARGIFGFMHAIPYAAHAWGTVMLEFFLAFALFFKRTRWIAFLSGTLFHLILDITMPISSYSQQMIASYILFVDPRGQWFKDKWCAIKGRR